MSFGVVVETRLSDSLCHLVEASLFEAREGSGGTNPASTASNGFQMRLQRGKCTGTAVSQVVSVGRWVKVQACTVHAAVSVCSVSAGVLRVLRPGSLTSVQL